MPYRLAIPVLLVLGLVAASCENAERPALIGGETVEGDVTTTTIAVDVGTTIGTLIGSTTTTTTSTTTTTTTTTIPETAITTTLPGLGVEIVGEEHYNSGSPVYASDLAAGYVSPDRDWLEAVGFNLPEGTEILAPFDGYVSVTTIAPWETFWGNTESRVLMAVVTEPDEGSADLYDTTFQLQTTLSNVNIPWGTSVTFAPISKGEVMAVVTGGQEHIPLRVENQTFLFVFGYFDTESGWYKAAPTIVWEFFPYVSAGEPTKPS